MKRYCTNTNPFDCQSIPNDANCYHCDKWKLLPDGFYSKKEILKASELGETSIVDAKHICTLLDDARAEIIKEHENKFN
jgi:hypothetical protein